MRRLALFAPILGIAIAIIAAACDGDGEARPTPTGPTTLSLTKTVVETGEGEFRFTLELRNEGDNAAVNIDTSDVWQEGLRVTAIGSVEGQQPKAIEDIGFEFIFTEFAAGKSVRVVYTATCVESGEWENVAVSGAQNAEAADASVTVTCP